jgi:transcriptional regulator with XRE-family HTH domain
MLLSISNVRRHLRELRKKKGLSQRKLAEKAGLNYKHLQRIEGKDWPGMQLGTVDRLASALGVEAWELLHPDGPGAVAKLISVAKSSRPPR